MCLRGRNRSFREFRRRITGETTQGGYASSEFHILGQFTKEATRKSESEAEAAPEV